MKLPGTVNAFNILTSMPNAFGNSGAIWIKNREMSFSDVTWIEQKFGGLRMCKPRFKNRVKVSTKVD
jgi:hypothetical protein